MTFERVVKQTFEAVQFDGTNLKDVYDFICAHHGNAKNISFKEFQNSHRPKEIPLNVSSNIEYYNIDYSELEKEWKERWSGALEEWRKYENINTYAKMEDHPEIVPAECLEEYRILILYSQDWRKDELYHFYLNDGYYRRLIGICKGDWFTYDGDSIRHCSKGYFKMHYEDEGWKPIE